MWPMCHGQDGRYVGLGRAQPSETAFIWILSPNLFPSSFHNALSAPSGIACCVLESRSSGVTGYHHEACPYITHVQYGFADSSDWTGFQATNIPTCFLRPTWPDNNCRSPHLWPGVSFFTQLRGTGGDVSAGCWGSSYALCHQCDGTLYLLAAVGFSA